MVTAHEMKFQSTLPAGEATHVAYSFGPALHISIHASRGGSDSVTWPVAVLDVISIHASRGGSDISPTPRGLIYWYFNPRFPRGKRPGGKPDYQP